MNGRTACVVAAALVLACQAAAWARATSARALGMGNAYSAVADEADMAAWNPALLGLPRRNGPVLAITAPSVNVGVGNNFLSFDSLLDILPNETGASKQLSDEQLQALLNGMPGAYWEPAVDGGVRTAIAIPPLRTSVHAQADVDVQGGLPRGIAELLRGNTAIPEVRVDGSKGSSISALTSVGLSHAIPLPLFEGRPSAIGVTARVIRGLAWGTIVDASGSAFTTDEEGRIGWNWGWRRMWAWPDPAGDIPGTLLDLNALGTGVAADVGFATQWNENVTWGLTVGNLGFVKWAKVQDKISTFDRPMAGLGYTPGEDGKQGERPEFKYEGVTVSGPQDGKSEVDGRLPAYGRLGVAWSGGLTMPRISDSPTFWNTPPIPVVISVDYQQGFGTGYGISTTPELHLGLETRPLGYFLPLRAGVAFGGVRPMAGVGAGLDLGPLRLDIASGTMYGIFGGAKGAYLAVTTNLGF